jgi:hypothetical protein
MTLHPTGVIREIRWTSDVAGYFGEDAVNYGDIVRTLGG